MQKIATISDYFLSLLTVTIALFYLSWHCKSAPLFLFSLLGLSGLFLLEAMKNSSKFHSYQQIVRGVTLLISIPILFYLIKPAG